MRKKNYVYIILVLLIAAGITIVILWKPAEKEQVIAEAPKENFQLQDTLNHFSILLPSKPVKKEEVLNNEGMLIKTTQYESIAPNKQEIVVHVLRVECDSCPMEQKNDLVMRCLIQLLKTKNISVQTGKDHKIGKYDALKFEQTIEGIPTQYITCTVNDKAYIYGETIADSTKAETSIYFNSFEIQ